VLEGRLQERKYICDEYSIVDISHWGWIYTAKRMGGGVSYIAKGFRLLPAFCLGAASVSDKLRVASRR
jgi:glutathione S-transferase